MKLLIVSFPCCEPIRQEFFASFQAHSGWDVSIVLPSRWLSEHGERRARRWPGFDGELLPLPVLLNGNIPLHFYRARMRRILQRSRPDVIYVHHEGYGVATFQTFLANQRSIRVPIGFYSAQNLLKHYPWPFSACEAYVYRHAAFALPITEAAAGVLRKKGYPGRLEVLPLPLDTGVFRPHGRNGQRRRRGGDLVVGYMGRLTAEKGVATLLTALSRPEANEVRAVIGGDGPLAGELKARAIALGLGGRVSWAGYLPHETAPHFYRRVDLLVVPSQGSRAIAEQFGRVVPEALACGVPVVASDAGELPRMMAATGGGWIFPQGDDAALAGVLGRVRDHPDWLEELGRKGRSEVERRFGLDHVTARFAAVIKSAQEQPHAG